MRRLYRYRGTVGVMSAMGQTAEEITLYDSSDDSKAPTRLNIYGGLAKYIYELEMTDAEERYLDADYVYDWNLTLVRIEIPSKVPNIPAKIIAQQDLNEESLKAAIEPLLNDRSLLDKMASNARAQASLHATDEVVAVIDSLVK